MLIRKTALAQNEGFGIKIKPLNRARFSQNGRRHYFSQFYISHAEGFSFSLTHQFNRSIFFHSSSGLFYHSFDGLVTQAFRRGCIFFTFFQIILLSPHSQRALAGCVISCRPMNALVVFCGASRGNDSAYTDEAYAFGALLAARGIQLIYGGASIGVMGAVANGCLENGGKAIGIIPDFFMTKEVAHDHLTQTIVVKTMHERKLLMYKMADGAVVLPGGFGTMDEFFEVLTWAQLGMHKKPIALFNIAEYYTPLMAFIQQAQQAEFIAPADRNLVLCANSAEDVIQKMQEYQPNPRKVWVHLDDL